MSVESKGYGPLGIKLYGVPPPALTEVEAMIRMGDEGCPYNLPDRLLVPGSGNNADLSSVSAGIGKQVRGGAIARADLAAGEAAELKGPRIPGAQGNGKA